MLSKLEYELLDMLLEHTDTYLTSQYLAKTLGCSDRTSRKYLGLLNETIHSQGASVVSKQGYGYQLKISDMANFEDYYFRQKHKRRQVTDVSSLMENKDRQRYLINQLFLENRQLSVAELSEELYLSRTTVSHLLGDIRSLVAPYHIRLKSSKYRMEIIGKESDIRHFIKDYFFQDSYYQSVFSLFRDEILEKTPLSEIISIVIDQCRNAQFSISDIVFHNLVLHISLMIKRIQIGYKSEEYGQFKDNGSIEYSIAQRIKERLEAYFNLQLPAQEVAFIALHLAGSAAKKELEEDLLKKEIKIGLEGLGQGLDLDLSSDQHLVNNLYTHFLPLLQRLDNQVDLSNPLKETILEKYSDIVNLVRHHFSKLPALSSYAISDDEWVYISLHILATMEKISGRRQPRVLLVCATGIGSARLLKNRLEKTFPDSLQVKKAVSYFELAELDLSEFDVIISSIDLDNMFLLLPVIRVGVLLEEEDVRRIEAFLNLEAVQNSKEEQAPKDKARGMTLLRPEQFLYLEEDLSKDDLLPLMISKLEPKLTVEETKDFRQQLELRERLGLIVFNEVLAFPHPAKALRTNEEVVVALLKRPMIWDEKHQSVQFVFLISPSTRRNQNLKELSPMLARFAERTDLQQQLLSSPSFEEFLELFFQ